MPNSMVPFTLTEDINSSAISRIWRFILVDWYIGRRPLALSTSVAFPLTHLYLMRHVHNQ